MVRARTKRRMAVSAIWPHGQAASASPHSLPVVAEDSESVRAAAQPLPPSATAEGAPIKQRRTSWSRLKGVVSGFRLGGSSSSADSDHGGYASRRQPPSAPC